MRVIVGGVTAAPPFRPGLGWTWLHFVRGLIELGHEAYMVDEIRSDDCIDAEGRPCSFDRSVQCSIFERFIDETGLAGRTCLVCDGGDQTVGLTTDEIFTVAASADLLLNMSGHLKADPFLRGPAHRAYVDLDPVHTQLWLAEYGVDLGFDRYDSFFTPGLNIGTPHSPIPDCGVRWHHFLQPALPELWDGEPRSAGVCFTTVTGLRQYDDLEFGGRWFRAKAQEFLRFHDLPKRSGQACEVALRDQTEQETRLLERGGWRVVEADSIPDMTSYHSYVSGSRGEISIVQHAYVEGRSGLFTDRAVHYLASGRPVVAQSTGFERLLPVGEGLLSFHTVEEAAAAMATINADYDRHCRAARDLVEEYFDYRRVLPRILEVATG